MNSVALKNPDEPAAQANWRDNPCFYVSVVDGSRLGLLAGPFQTHKEALGMVDQARATAQRRNAWAWFYAFGTVKMKNGNKPGVLNEDLGLPNG